MTSLSINYSAANTDFILMLITVMFLRNLQWQLLLLYIEEIGIIIKVRDKINL